MSRPATLAFLVTEDWYFLSHRLKLARAARDAGYRVVVIANDSGRSEEIRAEGLEYVPFDIDRGGMNPLRDLRSVARLAAVFRRERVDLVHLVAMKPILYGGMAARLAGVRGIVAAVAGLGFLFMGDTPARQALRAFLRGAYRTFLHGAPGVRCIVQNSDDRAAMVDRGMFAPWQMHIVAGSGVDLERFAVRPEPPGPAIVLTHTRMLADKGLRELAEAARILRGRGLEFELRFVGHSDAENPTRIPEEELHAWEQEGLIRYLGRRSDIPELLAGCHIACLPSYREGLPLSLIEAASAGRPIVTTDTTGCREVVADGENGFLVPLREAEPIADALEKLITDAELRARMGAESRRRAETRFAQEIIIEQTLALYREVWGAP